MAEGDATLTPQESLNAVQHLHVVLQVALQVGQALGQRRPHRPPYDDNQHFLGAPQARGRPGACPTKRTIQYAERPAAN